MNSSSLSQILSGKRTLPLRISKSIADKLILTPIERTHFMESVQKTKVSLDEIAVEHEYERFMLDDSYGAVVSEWEHYIVLDLMDLSDFNFNLENIGLKLGISNERAIEVMDNLINSGLLLRNEDGTFLKAHINIRTTEDVQSQVLRDANAEALDIAKMKLDTIETELRDFSVLTLAVDMEKLPLAKTIIREFRQKMMALMKDGDKTEVFQLGIQMYPMTEMTKKTE